MFWLVVIIIVVVVIVYNNNKKKKQQQSGQQGPQVHTQTPPRTQAPKAGASGATQTKKSSAPPKAGDPIDQAAFARAFAHMSATDPKAQGDKSAPKAEPKKSSAPPKAGDPIDQAAFARAFAHMSATDPKAQGGKSAPAEAAKPAAAPKAEPKKSSAPPKAGDPIDQAAFARAFAHMGVTGGKADDGKSAPKAEPPKADANQAALKQFHTNILGYYHSLWNRDTGSLYTELATMPIHHFAVQVKPDRLVESVWLDGDEIPLVSETEYAKLCNGDESTQVIPLSSQQEMDQLLGLIRDYLLHLGTVELRGDTFYPLRPGQSSGAPAGAPAGSGTGSDAPTGKAAQGFSQSDKDAQLRAQVQALLEKQKKDKPPKK